MNTSNVSPQSNIEQVRELLSPYLDNEVTTTERQLVEQALQTSSELRADLESLRQTVALLKAMPAMSAPRPFTLTAADVPAQATPQHSWLILPGWLSNLASMAFLLVALILGGLFLFSPMKSGSSPTEMVAYQAEAPQAAKEIPAEPTPEPAKEEAAPKSEAMPTTTAAVMAAESAKIASDETAPSTENAAAASPNESAARMGETEVEQSAAPPPAAAKEGPASLAAAPADESTKTDLMSAESATLQPAPDAAMSSMAAPEAESEASEEAVITENTITTLATATMPATIAPTATLTPSSPTASVSSQTVWLITGFLAALVLVGGLISWLKHSGKL